MTAVAAAYSFLGFWRLVLDSPVTFSSGATFGCLYLILFCEFFNCSIFSHLGNFLIQREWCEDEGGHKVWCRPGATLATFNKLLILFRLFYNVKQLTRTMIYSCTSFCYRLVRVTIWCHSCGSDGVYLFSYCLCLPMPCSGSPCRRFSTSQALWCSTGASVVQFSKPPALSHWAKTSERTVWNFLGPQFWNYLNHSSGAWGGLAHTFYREIINSSDSYDLIIFYF